MLNKDKNVLVTGITGFIGSHIAINLLNAGYSVRGTMRNLERRESILKTIRANTENSERLDFVKGELTIPEDWDSAMEGMDFVMHVASPLPFDLKKDANDLIIPAREGTLNVLRSANKHKVKRVVLTSSIAAIGLGHKEKNRTFTEEDWTNLNSKNNIPPYVQSKTIAESEAWKYISQDDVHTELAVINPGYVLGPLLEKDFSDSAEIVRKLLAGEIPGLPKIKFPLVDVRDVAEMHLWAMESPIASGQRFICVNKSSSYLEIAKILKEGFPEFGKRIKTFELPDFFIRLYGLFDKETKTIRVELGRSRSYNNSKSVKMFGWKPRSNKEAINSMAESMIKFGVV
jgi:nucleoside-diphosphate-sugar epimerase